MIRQPSAEELVAASAVDQVNGAIIVEGQEPDGEGEGILEVKKIDEELLQIQKAAQLDYQEGRFAEAEENYRQFLKYRPRNVVCICNLALVKLKTERYDEAEVVLLEAHTIILETHAEDHRVSQMGIEALTVLYERMGREDMPIAAAPEIRPGNALAELSDRKSIAATSLPSSASKRMTTWVASAPICRSTIESCVSE